jgi:hypothetical protein
VPPGEFEPVAPATGAARSRLGLSVGAVGVVLLLVMGLVVVRGLQGQSTGADNPDDLVTLLQSAITKKDPAAAIALLDPTEVPTLGDLYKTTVEKVRSSQDVDVPKALEAISISVTGVSHTTTYLGARNDVAKISFSSGELAYETHPEQLPDGIKRRMAEHGDPLPKAEHDSTNVSELQVTSSTGKVIDPFLVAVNEHGRWYLSITMTIGEYAVETADLPGGQFDDTPEPGPPASSPEAAVRTLLDAAVSEVNTGKGNGSPLMGLFPEAQTRAFRIYSKALRSQLDQAGGSFFSTDSGSYPTDSGGPSSTDPGASTSGDFTGGTTSSDGTFDGLESQCTGCGVHYRDLKVRTKTQGSTTYAVIDGLTVDYTMQVCDWSGAYLDSSSGPGGPATGNGDWINGTSDPCTDQTETTTLTWDGHCLTAKSTAPDGIGSMFGIGGRSKSCLGDPSKPGKLNATDFGITDVHVVVSSERGGWVIDPVATILDYGRTALSHLDDPKVRSILNDEH